MKLRGGRFKPMPSLRDIRRRSQRLEIVYHRYGCCPELSRDISEYSTESDWRV
jgi:hypothetical protein